MALIFAVMHLNQIFEFCIASVHSFVILFFKSDIDKSVKWSTILACPSLKCFFNRSDTKGTNSSKILCLMFVYAPLCKLSWAKIETGTHKSSKRKKKHKRKKLIAKAI